MRPTFVRRAALALSVLTLPAFAAAPALAQSAPGAPGTSQAIPEKVQPKTDTTPNEGRSSSENLSQKLDKTNGVIPAPQGVDPDMHKQAPATGTMPVVPPPKGAEAK